MGSVITRFVLLGPVAGCLGFVLTDQLLSVSGLRVSSLAASSDISSLLLTVPLLWLYGMLLAHLLGGLPAALAGFIYSQFIRRKNKNNSMGLRLLVGGSIGFLCGGLISPFFSSDMLAFIPWLVAGIFGGAAAASSIGGKLYEVIKLESHNANMA